MPAFTPPGATMKTLSTTAAAAFLACILAANYVTTEYGMVPILWTTATAGTYFAGLTFVLRDTVQDGVRALLPPQEVVETVAEPAYPQWAVDAAPQLEGLMVRRQVRREVPCSDWVAALPIIVLIVAGALLSYLISDPFIGLASGCAFLCAEFVDLCVYSPLRRRGYVRAAIASNIVGAVVDTFLFLWIAGFPIAGAWQGQIVGKCLVTGVVVGLVVIARGSRKVATA